MLITRERKKVSIADLIVLAAGGMGTPQILASSGIVCKPTLFVDPVLCVAAPFENAKQNRQISMPFGFILSFRGISLPFSPTLSFRGLIS